MTLQPTNDSRALMNAAVSLARSPELSALEQLSYALTSESFLHQLDSEQDYFAPPRNLRLARIMRALMDNSAASAHHLLAWLARQPVFLEFSQREWLLIQALAVVRPSPPDAIAFWDKHSQSNSPYLTLTIDSLIENGSYPALQLLESRLAVINHLKT